MIFDFKYISTALVGTIAISSLTISTVNSLTISQASESATKKESQSFYVAKNGSSKNSGTIDSPFATIADACKQIGKGRAINTIYVRGGVYTNPGYGSGGKNNRSLPAITCSGSSDRYLTIRPYQDEKVKFAFDSFNGVRLSGNYLIFKGFEVEGAAQDITYEEALADWWIGSKIYNGNGIVINGHNINVKDNIVHDTTGSAIFINNGGDYTNITDNIIYNAAWWSTKGTTAIGLINARTSDDSLSRNIQVKRNLIFASESRIFSRVPTKGFAELAIDEGSGTLVQVNKEDYQGGYLIKDNFYLYNGKGIAIARTNDVWVKNNTLYMNGSTINGRATGLRLNGGCKTVFANNAVVVDSEDIAYSNAEKYDNCNTADPVVEVRNNHLQGGDRAEDLPDKNSLVDRIFTDPANLDFSLVAGIPDNVGAPISVFKNLKTKADRYGIRIAPTNWEMNYEAQTKAIVESAPIGSTYEKSQQSEKVIVKLPPGKEFGGHNSFELRIRTPYEVFAD